VTAVRTGGRELSELVPDHVLLHVDGNELLPVVHGDRVAQELGTIVQFRAQVFTTFFSFFEFRTSTLPRSESST
jgi:hypothetical protein